MLIPSQIWRGKAPFPGTSDPPPLGYPRGPRDLSAGHSLQVYGFANRPKTCGGRVRLWKEGLRLGFVRSQAGGAEKGRCRGPDGAEQAAFAAGAGVESCAPVPGPELGLGLGRLRCLKMAELGELKVPAPSPIPIWTEPGDTPSPGSDQGWAWRARVGAGDVAGTGCWGWERSGCGRGRSCGGAPGAGLRGRCRGGAEGNCSCWGPRRRGRGRGVEV